MKLTILPLNLIPNQSGFEFTGIGHEGQVYPNMKVMINELNQHYVVGYKRLIGWVRNDKNELLSK